MISCTGSSPATVVASCRARGRSRRGRLKGALALKGALLAAGLGLDAKKLDIVFGSTRVAGDVSVVNFDASKLDVNLGTVALAFDDLRPLGRQAMRPVQPGSDTPGLAAATAA